MKSEFNLINREQVSAGLSILANFLLLLSTLIAVKTLKSRKSGMTSSAYPTSTQVTALAVQIFIVGSVVFVLTAYDRLIQRRDELQSGEELGSLLPNKFILLGALVSLFSNVLIAIGVGIKEKQEGQITII